MTVPQYQQKYDETAFMSPEDRLSQRHGNRDNWPAVPSLTIVTFQQYLFDSVTSREDAQHCNLSTDFYSLYTLGEYDHEVGIIGNFGIGAPAMAIVVDELIALGTELFCIVGGCGTLQSTVSPGDAVLIDEAIRDDGTSHHYLEPAERVTATPTFVDELTNHITKATIDTHVGPTWTTDGFYRETTAEVNHYAERDVLTVEMEIAALFAIAHYRNVIAGAALVPFDRLTDDQWEWDLPSDSREDRLKEVFALAIEAGLNMVEL